MDGYKLSKKIKGGGVALFIRRWIECEVLSLRNRHEQIESLWIRIRHQDNKENLMAAQPRGAC